MNVLTRLVSEAGSIMHDTPDRCVTEAKASADLCVRGCTFQGTYSLDQIEGHPLALDEPEPKGVAGILGGGSPLQILRDIVALVAVKVIDAVPVWAGAEESLSNEFVH